MRLQRDEKAASGWREGRETNTSTSGEFPEAFQLRLMLSQYSLY